MEDQSYLKHFITSDIYVLPSEVTAQEEVPTTSSRPVDPVDEKSEVAEEVNVISSEPVTQVEENNEVTEEPNVTTTPKIDQPEEKYTPPVYSGLFAKKVLVFVHEKGLKFGNQDLLKKILDSIGLEKDDVAILPTGHIETKEDFQWLKSLETKQILAFGLSEQWMKRMHSNLEKYKNHSMEQGYILFIDSLAVLDSDIEKKKQLWGQLKSLNGL